MHVSKVFTLPVCVCVCVCGEMEWWLKRELMWVAMHCKIMYMCMIVYKIYCIDHNITGNSEIVHKAQINGIQEHKYKNTENGAYLL